MVEFLRTSGISHRIDELIINAKTQITFVSPYLKFPKTLYERILEKTDEDVRIIFIYGKSELSTEQSNLLKKIKNISVYYLENLHAKCYINESAGIITSMNLHDFSAKNNREMGIYFEKGTNELLYSQVNAEVESIIKASVIKNSSSIINNTILERPFRNQAINEKKSSFNSKLFKLLVTEFNSYVFTYKHITDQIVCQGFGAYFYLEISFTGASLRVDFRLKGDYNLRKTLYNQLEMKSVELKPLIPSASIHFGNQMKRIKLDFPMKYKKFEDIGHEPLEEYLHYIKTSKNLFDSILTTIPT